MDRLLCDIGSWRSKSPTHRWSILHWGTANHHQSASLNNSFVSRSFARGSDSPFRSSECAVLVIRNKDKADVSFFRYLLMASLALVSHDLVSHDLFFISLHSLCLINFRQLWMILFEKNHPISDLPSSAEFVQQMLRLVLEPLRFKHINPGEVY